LVTFRQRAHYLVQGGCFFVFCKEAREFLELNDSPLGDGEIWDIYEGMVVDEIVRLLPNEEQLPQEKIINIPPEILTDHVLSHFAEECECEDPNYTDPDPLINLMYFFDDLTSPTPIPIRYRAEQLVLGGFLLTDSKKIRRFLGLKACPLNNSGIWDTYREMVLDELVRIVLDELVRPVQDKEQLP